MGLNVDKDMDKIMEMCQITIVASVEQGKPWSKRQLDIIEGDLQDRIMTFEKQGGMNRREERKGGCKIKAGAQSPYFKKKRF